MALLSFCGLLTLQVGVAMLAVVFFALASLVFAVNVFDYYDDPHNSWPVPLLLVIIFVVLMIFAGIFMFFSAYNESRKLCIVSVALIVLVMAYWIILSCFAFANNPNDLRRVCVNFRCGESFWLADLKHREVNYGKTSNASSTPSTNATTPPTSTVAPPEKPNKRRKRIPDYLDLNDLILNSGTETKRLHINMTMSNGFSYVSTMKPDSERKYGKYIFVQEDDGDDVSSDVDKDDEEGKEGDDIITSSSGATARYKFGLPMVGAILLFVINFLFLLFTILIMWSYAQELRWADYYEDEPPYTAQDTY